MANFKKASSIVSGRKTQFLYEYMYQQAIDMINNGRKERGEDLIPVSRARMLRDEVMETMLRRSGVDFTDAKQGEFKNAIDSVLSKYNNSLPVFLGEGGSAFYESGFNRFIGYTGWSSNRDRSAEGSVKEPMIPLSPYDNRIAYRGTVMRNGGRTLFIKAEDMNVESSRVAGDAELFVSTGRGEFRSAGPLLTNEDQSGIVRLMRFIPENDYESLSDWVTSQDPASYMSSKAVDRSVAILSYLQDNGYSFTIERDANPGQLRATIDGTKLSVRIMDNRENESYVGSIDNDGKRIYFAHTSANRGEDVVMDIDPTDSVNLLKWAMGDSVLRRDTHTPVGEFGSYRSGSYTRPNSYYSNGGNYSAVYKNMRTVEGRPSFVKMTMHVSSARQDDVPNLRTREYAEEYLKNAVDAARRNFKDRIDVDHLIREANEHRNDEDYLPVFSGDDRIAAVQQAYYNVLIGKDVDILKVEASESEYKEAVSLVDSLHMEGGSMDDYLTGSMVYHGDAEEKVRQHFDDLTDDLIGTYEYDMDGKRFNPARVALYMDPSSSSFRNTDFLVRALRKADMSADDLKGDDMETQTIKHKMIKFDPVSGKRMMDSEDPFVRSIFDTIKATFRETGCDVKDHDILMDDNGVIECKGTRTFYWNKNTQVPFTEYIGQIFVPDELGMVETKFNGGGNYIFVPGYNASVSADGMDKFSLEQRTFCIGYEQAMKRAVAYQIRSDLIDRSEELGDTTNVNRVHHQMYDTRFPLDIRQRAIEKDGLKPDVFEAVVKTLSRRVRYDNMFREGSTINAAYQANKGSSLTSMADLVNDNFFSAYKLSGRRNMTVMSEESSGYFDLFATSTSTNQGIVRFLTESAKVDGKGRIIRGTEGDTTPLMKIPDLRYAAHSPFDRRQMVFSNLLTARAIVDDVHMAQMTFGGWTFDDGYVITKDFAEKHMIRDTEDNLRPIRIGDKLCDFGGNKGVISFVVDLDMDVDAIMEQVHIDSEYLNLYGNPSMDEKGIACMVTYKDKEYTVTIDPDDIDSYDMQAARQIQRAEGFHDCDKMFAWFKANPKLDIVGSPYPAVSRYNGTSDKMLMEHPDDLVGPDGTVYTGCMGTTSFMITDMPVDEKTHIYGEEEMAEGKGRKASSQLAWALASADCTAVLDEFYKSNSGKTANLREYLISMGLDLSETGVLRDHYEPHEGEVRRVFEMPPLAYLGVGGNSTLDLRSMRKAFTDLIDDKGGIMEIPFPLKYPEAVGTETPPLNDGKTDVIYKKEEWERKGYYRKDGTYVRPTIVRRHEDASTERQVRNETYGLPILSAQLRSGQEIAEGRMVTHDYTNQYRLIFEAACRYRDELSKGENARQEVLDKWQNDAQRRFNQITTSIRQRQFDNQKHNIFKNGIMSNRLPNSATAVITADPRLDIDEIAMGPEMAQALGVKEGEHLLVWRDPILRDAGVRYMRVKIDEKLIGCAIQPSVDKPFDADFDGDAVGMVNLMTPAARREAYKLLGFHANLIDDGALSIDENGNEVHPSFIHNNMDIASVYYADPDLKAEREFLDKAASDGKIAGERLVKMYSRHIHQVFDEDYGTDMICYSDPKSHIKSIAHVVENGAKGSYKKLGDHCKYMGYEFEYLKDAEGKIIGIDFDSIKDTGNTLSTYSDAKDVMYATGIKSFGTGVAGKFSQRGVAVLRDECIKEVLGTTYPNTQGILQAKHDPADAANRYDILMTSGRSLWRGYELSASINSDGKKVWEVVKNPEDGKPVQATKEEFTKQFIDLYGPDGLDCAINPHYAERIAEALSGEDGRMLNLEKDPIPGASALDSLTYSGKGFDGVVEAAKEGINLFEGKYTKHFAPSTVRRNVFAAENPSEDRQVKAIMKGDTRETVKETVSRTDKVVTVERRMPVVPEYENAVGLHGSSSYDGPQGGKY